MFCSNCGKKIISDTEISCQNCGEKNFSQNKKDQPVGVSVKEYHRLKARNLKLGLFWLLGPSFILAVVLALYAINMFVFGSINLGESNKEWDALFKIINVLLALIATIDVIAILVGFFLGIFYLSKKIICSEINYDERSGKGDFSVIPEEVKKWNWAAFALAFIWGISHRVWICFLMFIPLVNIVVAIYLGINGNELAWRAQKWESVDVFLKIEKKWAFWGIITFVLAIVMSFFNVLLSIVIGNF